MSNVRQVCESLALAKVNKLNEAVDILCFYPKGGLSLLLLLR